MHIFIPPYSVIRRESRALAMGLIIVGAALGMYMNFYFGNIGWNNILMLGALLALPNWENLSRLRLKYSNRTFRNIIIFQFFCIMYMVVGETIDSNGLIFLLFTVFMLIGIMSQNINDMPMIKVVHYAWIFGWICLIFCGISLGTGVYFIEDAKSHSGTGYQSILVDLSMAGNLYTIIVCSFYFLNSSRKKQILAVLSIILSLIFIIILGKRTPLIVSLAMIAVFVFRFHAPSLRIRKKTFYLFVLLILLVVSLLQIPEISDRFIYVCDRSLGGISDMFRGTSSTGLAAVERYELRNWAINYITEDFTPLNYIIGAGYMTKWLDNPLLQAYLDMGLIGVCVYFYYVIFKPLRITFSRLSKNRLIFWGCALNFYNILSSLNSGTPYGHIRWIPLIVLLLAIHYTKTTPRIT